MPARRCRARCRRCCPRCRRRRAARRRPRCRAAGIGIVGGEHGGAGADLGQGPGSRDQAGEGHGVGAVEGELAVVEHIAQNAAGVAAVAELQGAGRDRRTAGVCVVGGEHGGAGTDLSDASGAEDRAAEARRLGAFEGQPALVEHIAHNAAAGAAIAELQGAVRDGRAAIIRIVAGEHGGAGAVLPDVTAPGNDAGQDERIGAVEAEQAVVDHVADDAAAGAAIAENYLSARNRGAAGIAAGTRQNQDPEAGCGEPAGTIAVGDRSRKRQRISRCVDGAAGCVHEERVGERQVVADGLEGAAIEDAGTGADRSVVGDLKRAAGHRRAAGIAVGRHHRQGAGAELGQLAWSVEHLPDGEDVGRVGDVETAAAGTPVEDARRRGKGGAGHLQGAAVEGDCPRGAAEIVVGRNRHRAAGRVVRRYRC